MNIITGSRRVASDCVPPRPGSRATDPAPHVAGGRAARLSSHPLQATPRNRKDVPVTAHKAAPPVGALALLAVAATLALAAPLRAEAAAYHRCSGTLPYRGYDGYPGFWRSIEASATPCRSGKPLAREAAWRWSRRSRRGNVGATINLTARIAGGARYRCSFRWHEVREFQYVNKVTCKAHGGKRVRFRSIPAGD
jgi:hypothetical protein